MSTLLLLGVNLVLIFLLSYASSAGPLRPDYLMGVSLTLSCYILFFYSTTGDWVRELANPYIYLAPEAPFPQASVGRRCRGGKGLRRGRALIHGNGDFYRLLSADGSGLPCWCMLQWACFSWRGMCSLCGCLER